MNQFHLSDLAAPLSSEFSIRFTQALLHFLWQGLAIGLLVWVIDHLAHRASSHARHAACVSALLVMLACVPTTYILLDHFSNGAPAGAGGQIAVSPAEFDIEGVVKAPAMAAEARAASNHPAEDVDRVHAVSAANLPLASWTWRLLHTLSAWFAPYTTLAYLIGVTIMLARLGLALRSGHAMRKSASLLTDPAILAMAARQAQRIGLKITPAVAYCRQAAAPLVVGIVRPMILLPTAIACGVSPNQLESILAHELAHLKRLDLVMNLVQRLAESLLFFHPAAWYVIRRISVERENCCDDCVLAAGWGRLEYADALVRMAEVCAAARGLAGVENATLLAASGESTSQLKRRVLRLLDDQDHLRMGISRAGLVAAAMILLGVAAIPIAGSWKNDAQAGPAENTQPAAAEAPGTAEPSPEESKDDITRRTLLAALLERQNYLETTYRDEERLINKELSDAEQHRTKAEASLEEAKRLAAQGLVTPEQLEAAEAALKQAAVEVNKAQVKLDVLRKFTKEKTIRELDRKVVVAIEALLDQHVALKVADWPLIFVLDDLEKTHQIPVIIDLKDVHARGLSEHTRVTVDVTDKPLRDVFQIVLTSAGLDFQVTAEGIHVPAPMQRDADAPNDEAAKPAPFKPFECQIIDAVTGKPINDVTVNFLFKSPATKEKPEETVANLVYTNVGISRFWFLVPDELIGRPELEIQWGPGIRTTNHSVPRNAFR